MARNNPGLPAPPLITNQPKLDSTISALNQSYYRISYMMKISSPTKDEVLPRLTLMMILIAPSTPIVHAGDRRPRNSTGPPSCQPSTLGTLPATMGSYLRYDIRGDFCNVTSQRYRITRYRYPVRELFLRPRNVTRGISLLVTEKCNANNAFSALPKVKSLKRGQKPKLSVRYPPKLVVDNVTE